MKMFNPSQALFLDSHSQVSYSPKRGIHLKFLCTILLWSRVKLCVEQVALKLVPDNKAFLGILLAEEEFNMLKEEIQSFVTLLLPPLDEIHKILVRNNTSFTLKFVNTLPLSNVVSNLRRKHFAWTT